MLLGVVLVIVGSYVTTEFVSRRLVLSGIVYAVVDVVVIVIIVSVVEVLSRIWMMDSSIAARVQVEFLKIWVQSWSTVLNGETRIVCRKRDRLLVMLHVCPGVKHVWFLSLRGVVSRRRYHFRLESEVASRCNIDTRVRTILEHVWHGCRWTFSGPKFLASSLPRRIATRSEYPK